MAKTSKSKLATGAATRKSVRGSKNKNKDAASLQVSKKSKAAKTSKVNASKAAVGTAANAETSAEKKESVSQKLLEAIERQKQKRLDGGSPKPASKKSKKQKSAFGRPAGRPPGRRGRRPKRMAEYTPSNNQDEENYSNDSEYERIEYDTGIRLRDGMDDASAAFERFDDYDEELNFDN